MILYTHFHLILCFILQVKQSEATTEKKIQKKKRIYTPEQKKESYNCREKEFKTKNQKKGKKGCIVGENMNQKKGVRNHKNQEELGFQ